MARRRITAAQARERRSKKIAIGLGVLFAVVCAVQGPKLLKELHPKRAAVPPPASTTVGATSTAAGAPAAPAVSRQLQSFSLLPLKNPFKPLVKVTAPVGGATGGSAASKRKTSEPAPTPAAKPAPAAKPGATVTPTVKFTPTPPNAALIKTNGRREVVTVGGGFPTGQPRFKLVSLAKNKKGVRTGIKIGVLGGSFVAHAPTVSLAKGHKVTLADQADGSRYVIELVRLTTAAPQPSSSSAPGTSTQMTTTTPATTTPATTTPTTTTPGPTTTTPTTG